MPEVEEGFLIGAPISILFHELQRRVADRLAEDGYTDLSPAYMPVFQLLGPDGDTVTALARRAGVSKQAMGYLVGYLDRRGYLSKRPHATDGRAVVVSRTDRGWDVTRLALDVVQEAQRDWARLLGEQELKAVLAGLRQLVGRMVIPRRSSVRWTRSAPPPWRASGLQSSRAWRSSTGWIAAGCAS
jgi:DNA-binding MarR family transcriptional regulator